MHKIINKTRVLIICRQNKDVLFIRCLALTGEFHRKKVCPWYELIRDIYLSTYALSFPERYAANNSLKIVFAITLSNNYLVTTFVCIVFYVMGIICIVNRIYYKYVV